MIREIVIICSIASGLIVRTPKCPRCKSPTYDHPIWGFEYCPKCGYPFVEEGE